MNNVSTYPLNFQPTSAMVRAWRQVKPFRELPRAVRERRLATLHAEYAERFGPLPTSPWPPAGRAVRERRLELLRGAMGRLVLETEVRTVRQGRQAVTA